jgi:hypothetical protein
MSRPRRRQPPIAALVLGCVALAGCGATGTEATDATAGHVSRDLAFSQCMRTHGVPNFPDPTANGLQLPIGVNAESPAFKSAQRACKQYLPDKGAPPATSAKDRAAALAFSRCMRAHGLLTFPDPAFTSPRNAQRVLVLREMVFAISATIDPKSPAFRRAASACGVATPDE